MSIGAILATIIAVVGAALLVKSLLISKRDSNNLGADICIGFALSCFAMVALLAILLAQESGSEPKGSSQPAKPTVSEETYGTYAP